MFDMNDTARVNNEWVMIADASEGAFQIQVPRGWRSQAQTIRTQTGPRTAVTSESPDGSTFLFLSDPELPLFQDPGYLPPGMPVFTPTQPYVPAHVFLPNYIQHRYGRNGARIIGVGPSPEVEQRVRAAFQKNGMPAEVTGAAVSFEYQNNGSLMRGLFHASVAGFQGVWLPDVSGVLTTGDASRYVPLLMHMAQSYQSNPQWQQNENALHQQKMASIRANDQQTRATMQAGHQARMDAIHQAGAVNTQIWNDRMAQNDFTHQQFMDNLRQPSPYAAPSQNYGDHSHRQFLNYVTDQETVVDGGGQGYQVDTGHDRYFVNRQNNTYIGTDSTTSREDLRSRYGVNPDDYEETRIQR